MRVEELTRTGFPLSALLLQFRTRLAEDAAGDDELLDLLGAFEDVEDLAAGCGRPDERL
ncbi:hypothetical protein [Nocardia brasiliensis]|uniref:hypothetical protein n=1 Tax=Nocardia brasiliensis TaxID=37326 RepID=UPI002454465C|nr:hypothetical protein [Nocardia brasiliensis]